MQKCPIAAGFWEDHSIDEEDVFPLGTADDSDVGSSEEGSSPDEWEEGEDDDEVEVRGAEPYRFELLVVLLADQLIDHQDEDDIEPNPDNRRLNTVW